MRTCLATVLVVLGGAGLTNGQDKEKDKDKGKMVSATELDKKAAVAAYDAAVIGTDLFNTNKDYAGCYRVYQGALVGLLPALDHHPALVASVRAKLDKAKSMQPGEGAGLLREALEEVQDLNRAKKTLWDRIGGELGGTVLVLDWLGRVAGDPKVNFTRNGKLPNTEETVKKVTALVLEHLSFMTGGPGKDSVAEIQKFFAGMNYTEGEAALMYTHFLAAMGAAKLPQVERIELGEKVLALRKQLFGEKK